MRYKNISLYDSSRTIDMDEIKEYCIDMDIEIPEEDSEDYWDIINRIREEEWDVFEQDVKYNYHFSNETFIVTGTLGLWDGAHKIAAYVKCCGLWEVIKWLYGKDTMDMRVEYDGKSGAINVYAYHHDGCNCFEIHALSKKGKEFVAYKEDNYTFYWNNQHYLFRKLKPSDMEYADILERVQPTIVVNNK